MAAGQRGATGRTPSTPSWAPSEGSCPPNEHVTLLEEGDTDLADEIIAFGAACGVILDDAPWKRATLADWSARRDGKWLHGTDGLSGPRQMGKSWDGIGFAAMVACLGGYKVLWSDHNYSTTREMLRRFRDIFGMRPNDRGAKRPRLNAMVAETNNETSQESITFRSGGKLGFSTRTKTSNLGFEWDILVLDEAQELQEEHMVAMLPTTSGGSKHDSKVIYLGTPERPGGRGTKFGEEREKILRGVEPRASWREYGLGRELTEDEYADDAALARLLEVSNPSVGYSADVDAILRGVHKMLRVSASQEYFGYWLPSVAGGIVSHDDWKACEVEPGEVAPGGRLAYGVMFSRDGSTVALAAATRPDEGRPHVELVEVVETSSGIGWLVDWLATRVMGEAGAERTPAVVLIDGKSGVDDLHERLVRERGCPRKAVLKARSDEAVAAASRLDSDIREHAITHIAQERLDQSALTVVRRKIGTGGGWGFGGDFSAPIEACALAHWGVMTTKRDPTRVQEGNF